MTYDAADNSRKCYDVAIEAMREKLASFGKQTFLDGKVSLYSGDCLEVLKLLPEASVDSVVCDPPYHLTSIVKRFGAENAKPPISAIQRRFAKTGAAMSLGPDGKPTPDQYGRLSKGFMGKVWDGGDIAFRVELWQQVMRVLRPGGHLVAFGGTRTYHRMVCAIEDAGFECRDAIMWHYGSGFPKSHDVSKGIDKAAPRAGMFEAFAAHFGACWATSGLRRSGFVPHFPHYKNAESIMAQLSNWKLGKNVPSRRDYEILRGLVGLSDEWQTLIERVEAEREVTGADKNWGIASHSTPNAPNGQWDITAPATDAAKQWQGWGTALKPATEIICLARKPFAKGMTVAANVLQHSVGALNIDACRVSIEPSDLDEMTGRSGSSDSAMWGGQAHKGWEPKQGRWPANLIHDGSEEVIAAFPETTSGMLEAHHAKNGKTSGIYGDFEHNRTVGLYGDSGPAARFFYTAKADSEDRIASKHPTIKPVSLMRWLSKLVTPPGGVILDPFAGSGTTGEAAYLEGFRAILIEREAEYCGDIARRMDLIVNPTKREAVCKTKNDIDRPVEELPLFAGGVS